MLSDVACPAVPYFSTLFHKRRDLKKKRWTQNVCFDFRYRFCPKHFSFEEEFSEILQINNRSSSEVPVLLCQILMKL